MQKIKRYLISRLILVLLCVAAGELLMSFLTRNVLFPFAAGIAKAETNELAFSIGDYFTLLRAIFSGVGTPVLLNLLFKSGAFAVLLLALALLLAPIVAGILFYAQIAVRAIDRLQEKRDAERQAYDEERNLMLSDFAHDLRTPIMTISGYAGALADGVIRDPEKEKEYLQAIRAKADRMRDLINDLFDFAKLGSAGYGLKKEETDLHELLREAAAQSFTDAEEAGMELLAEIPEAPYSVMADRVQTQRIFQNLLSNALRHNPSGTKILVKTEALPGFERLFIADDGVRIEKSEKELFAPFVREDNARSSSGGSGLGLSIASKIAEMHGWELSLMQPCGAYTKAFVLQVPERAGVE